MDPLSTPLGSRSISLHKDLVQQTAASLQGDGATTACGKKLLNKGRCLVHAAVQNYDFDVAFKDMETELPILSVRKMVKNQNDVISEESGGSIRNRKTGRVIKFFEHEGVYFLKMKVKDPIAMEQFVAENSQPFQRHGK